MTEVANELDSASLPAIYISSGVRDKKAPAAENLEALVSLYGLNERLTYKTSLEEIRDGEFWLMPVFLGMAHRLSNGTARDFTYFAALSQAEKNKINESLAGYIVLDMAVEHLSSHDDQFALIHQGAHEAGLKVEKLVLVNCNARSSDEYEVYCNRLGLKERALVVPFNACLWTLIGHNRDEAAFEKKKYLEQCSQDRARKRGKKFLSTNGRLRPHRVVTLLYLMREGILEQGYVSFLGYGAGASVDYSGVFEDSLKDYTNFAGLHDQIHVLNRKMPMTLDTGVVDANKDKKIISSKLPWMAPDPDLYLDSYFSLVTETIVRDYATIFLTPITFKPIMSMHPFVLIAGCGALGYLRELGFETFSDEIDESYDEIKDFQRRTAAALEEGRRLASMPRDQLHEIYYRLYPKIQHNFEMFWSRLYPNFDQAIKEAVSKPTSGRALSPDIPRGMEK